MRTHLYIPLLVLAASGCGKAPEPSQNPASVSSTSASSVIRTGSDLTVERVNALGDAYVAMHGTPCTWWLKSFSTRTELAERLAEADREATRVVLILKKYRNVSPLSHEIWKTFQYRDNIQPCVFQDETFKFMKGARVFGRETVHLSFLSAESMPLPPVYFGFIDPTGPNGNPVMVINIAGINMPEPIRESSIVHEFGHALKWKSRRDTKTPENPDHAAEEVEMERLTYAILNTITGGRYGRLIGATWKSHHSSDWKTAATSLTLADLKAFDRALGCSNAGSEAASTLFYRYVLHTAFSYTDANEPDRVNRQHDGEEAYRWMRTLGASQGTN